MNAVVVIQARTGSTRLPGKVLLPLAGRPLLERMVQRVRLARTPSRIVVATTAELADEAIAEICGELGVPCFRGDTADLLDRHYRAGLEHEADAVVKVPSDCPLIDPGVIDLVVGTWLADPGSYDYVGNLHPPSWPDGQDVEVIPMDTLEIAWREAVRPFEREHTTPFIWERPDRFRCANLRWSAGMDLSMTHRWTIDYPDDYRFICAVFDELFPLYGHTFGVEEVLHLLERRPEIGELNARLAGVNWYRNHLDELATVDASMTRFPATEEMGSETATRQ